MVLVVIAVVPDTERFETPVTVSPAASPNAALPVTATPVPPPASVPLKVTVLPV